MLCTWQQLTWSWLRDESCFWVCLFESLWIGNRREGRCSDSSCPGCDNYVLITVLVLVLISLFLQKKRLKVLQILCLCFFLSLPFYFVFTASAVLKLVSGPGTCETSTAVIGHSNIEIGSSLSPGIVPCFDFFPDAKTKVNCLSASQTIGRMNIALICFLGSVAKRGYLYEECCY